MMTCRSLRPIDGFFGGNARHNPVFGGSIGHVRDYWHERRDMSPRTHGFCPVIAGFFRRHISI